MEEKKDGYLAFKLEGVGHWFWFQESQVTEEKGWLVAKNGWGKNGVFTEINCRTNLIVGRMSSEHPQYK